MKLIKAYIRHIKVGDVYNALKNTGFIVPPGNLRNKNIPV